METTSCPAWDPLTLTFPELSLALTPPSLRGGHRKYTESVPEPLWAKPSNTESAPPLTPPSSFLYKPYLFHIKQQISVSSSQLHLDLTLLLDFRAERLLTEMIIIMYIQHTLTSIFDENEKRSVCFQWIGACGKLLNASCFILSESKGIDLTSDLKSLVPVF